LLERTEVGLGELSLAPERVERVARVRSLLDRVVQELVFEGRLERQPMPILQCREATFQETARADRPRRAIQLHDVSHHEVLSRMLAAIVDAHSRFGSGC
jgi:hypothetical protein